MAEWGGMGRGATTPKSPPSSNLMRFQSWPTACQTSPLKGTKAPQIELTTLFQILILVLPSSVSNINILSINVTQKISFLAAIRVEAENYKTIFI